VEDKYGPTGTGRLEPQATGIAAAGRAEQVPASSILAFGLRVCVFVACLFGIYFALRQGVAAWYFRDELPQHVETAAKWDPGNPQYADTLANLLHFYSENPDPERIVALCEEATRLSPNDAHDWSDLGSAYDWAGRPQDATRAFERALRLFPNSPEINWRLANFYVRTNRTNDALLLLRKMLLVEGVQDQQVFSLVSRTGAEPDAVMTKMLPARRSAFVDYLNFQLSSGNINAAGEVWAGLLKSGLGFEVGDAFPYFDALIRNHNVDAASEVWRELADRFPAEVRSRISPPNLAENGDFDFPILNGGFDWRVNPVEGVTVRVNSARGSRHSGSIQITFDGSRNVEYGDVFEFVPAQPGRRYEFSAELRPQEITTDSGPRFQIFDEYGMDRLFVSTENVVGDADWSRQKLSFRTGPDTRLLVVRVHRPASLKFDNKISGTISIRHVSLIQENSR
jgi:Tetratricopeptide repeat